VHDWRVIIFSVLLSLLCVQVYLYLENGQDEAIQSPTAVYMNSSLESRHAGPRFFAPNAVDFVHASQAGIPAVVSIQAFKTGEWLVSDDKMISEGSGVLISPDGYLVTNNHVIANSDYIYVRTFDNRKYKATKIGVDLATDVAVLKIDRKNSEYINYGNSDDIHVGDWVLAIGNPYHLNSTVTSRIVSATSRNINLLQGANSVESFIQTDAIVNEGNSGGALVNTDGKLIGLITAIFTRDGRFEGYSFAVPANLVRKVSSDLIKFGSVRRGVLGISIENLNQDNTFYHNDQIKTGVFVRKVNKGSAAEKAGIREGDIILRIEGQMINQYPRLQEKVAQYSPGDTINMEILRDKKMLETKVVLESIVTTEDKNIRSDIGIRDLGFELRTLAPNDPTSLGEKGIFVNSVYRNSKADESGIKPGFIITGINGKLVTTVDQLIRLMQNNFFLEIKGYYGDKHQMQTYRLYRKNLFL